MIPQKNSEELVKAIEKFLNLSAMEQKKRGLAGRKKVEKCFDRQIIVNAYMKEMYKI